MVFWPPVFLVLVAHCVHCTGENGVSPRPCQALHVKQILPVLAVWGSPRTREALELLQTSSAVAIDGIPGCVLCGPELEVHLLKHGSPVRCKGP